MIPVNEPSLGPRDLENALDCLRSGWISSSGPYVEQFENGWAAYCGRRYGISVANGTVALHLALSCLDLEPGAEVIMPSFTIISCALAALYNHLVPVLVDCDPETWCMDVEQVESKISPRTRAIMPVHIYGHPVNMDPLLRLARQNELAIVEDAAEAHGAEYLTEGESGSVWRRCGSFGVMSCFSFYANKIINTGEGGMVLTDDPELAEKARTRRNLCFGQTHRFLHEDLGFNFRLTNLQAALGVGQLENVDALIERKKTIAARYSRRLKGLEGLCLPVQKEWARSVWWMYGLVASASGPDARVIAERLSEAGIETRPFFLGMHEQPAFVKRGIFKGEQYPVSENLARRGLYLPSGLGTTDDQIDKVCDAVVSVLS